MPVLRARIEGRGNGVKTVIENMSDIAHALERPPAYTTKFFGFELGAQTTVDEKKDKYVVNGRHDADQLAKILDVFIDKFLLCGTCRNPETTMEIVKNGNIQMRCMACGETTAVDMRHRLSAFIQKNPPGATRYAEAKKQAEERQNQASATATVDKSDNQEGMGDAVLDASGLKAEDDFGESWEGSDFSEAAMQKRRHDLLGTGGATLADESSPSASSPAAGDPVDGLSTYLTQKPTPSSKDILQFVKTTAMANGWSESNSLAAVFGALFGKDILTNLKSRAPILRLFVHTASDQKQVLYLIERLASRDSTASLKISSVLNGFYEAEILEEEVLFKWFKNPTKKIDQDLGRALRDRSAKFIEWLQTADDEEEDDEEDEE